jgi:transposase
VGGSRAAHRRYWALTNKSKPSPKVIAALARELVGFVWAIGKETEQTLAAKRAA